MPIDDRINTSGTQTDRVSEDWSKAASSFNMLEQHLQQPSQKLDLGYDPIIGGIGPMFEQHLPFINDLSTATDFADGDFRTTHRFEKHKVGKRGVNQCRLRWEADK